MQDPRAGSAQGRRLLPLPLSQMDVLGPRAGADPPDSPGAGHSVPNPSPCRDEHAQIPPKGTSGSDVVGSTQTTDFRRGRKKVMPQLTMPGCKVQQPGETQVVGSEGPGGALLLPP